MQMELAMNTTKTQYSENTACLMPLAVDGDELEEVDEFVYLGSLVSAGNNTSKEIRKRILDRIRAS